MTRKSIPQKKTAPRSRKTILMAALLPLGLMLSGCATQIQEAASADFQPVYPVEDPSAVPAMPTGGIYTDTARGLFANDRRAARVGDILTVQFVEKMAATKSQSDRGQHSSSFTVTLPSALAGGFASPGLDSSAARDFSGQGAAAQSNSLQGRLSVIVMRELPGGNLEIIGQKKLTLNNGNEYIRLTGIVRPEDISADNVVLSDRLANANIQYVGAGDVADTAQAGWLNRLLSTVSPL